MWCSMILSWCKLGGKISAEKLTRLGVGNVRGKMSWGDCSEECLKKNMQGSARGHCKQTGAQSLNYWSFSLFGRSWSKSGARYSIFGSHLKDVTDFNMFNCILFWGVQKPQRDLCNLSVISGLHVGPKLTMASVLDSMLSSTKVKAKVRIWKRMTCKTGSVLPLPRIHLL